MRYRFFGCVLFVFAALTPFAVQADVASSTTFTDSVMKSVTSSVTSTAPIILEMGDGRFYNPTTGMQANSRDLLLQILNEKGMLIEATTTEVTATSSVEASSSVDVLHQDFPLLNAITRGWSQLQATLDARDAAQKKLPVSKRTPYSVSRVYVAIWDKTTDAISVTDVAKTGGPIKLSVDSDGITIKAGVSNGVNTAYAVDDPNHVVVAIAYPITKTITVRRKKVTTVSQMAIYTPYSDALNTTEMVAYGKATLEKYVSDAFQALRNMGIRSRAFPNQLLADTVDPDLVKGILLIEHMGPVGLATRDPNVLNPFFVVIGANQSHAYNYSLSSASALGLVQFIPKTYALFAKRPELGLVKDFQTGMRDPANAIRAEIAYLDASLAELPADIKAVYATDRAQVNEYLAAAYNGGVIRTARAIQAWNDRWAEVSTASVASLKAKEKSLNTQIAAVTKKIKKATKKTKPALMTQLATLKSTLATTTADRKVMESSALHPETAQYVQKYRNVIAIFHPTVTVALAE